MSSNTKTINFRELYEKLPHDIQELLYSESISIVMDSIANKYKLPLEREGDLAASVGFVLYGILHPKDFITELSNKLGIDKETAKKIADDVNQQIFQKVRVSLRKIHGITEEEITNKELGIKAGDTAKPKIIPPAPPPPKPPEMKIMPKFEEALPKPLPISPLLQKKDMPPVLRLPRLGEVKAGLPAESQTRTSPIREVPKNEPRPLEIKPINIPVIKPEAEKKPQIISAPPPQPKHPEVKETIPQIDRGLEVMPHSSAEISLKARADKVRVPPTGLQFLDKRQEKKLEPLPAPPPPPKATDGQGKPKDQYREQA